jgi:glutamate dehydrogenase
MSAVTELWATSFEQALSRLSTPEHAGGAPPSVAEDERGNFLSSLPPGYAEATSPEDAAADWLEMSSLLGAEAATGDARTGGHASRLVLCPCRPGAPGDFRLRRVGLARVELSSFLPVVESFGLAVVEAVPWHFEFGHGRPGAYVDDIGLRVDTPVMGPGGFDPFTSGPRLVDALEAVLAERAELGPLNRLVIGADLDWREVDLLSAYCAYRRAVGGPAAAEAATETSEALMAFPACAAAVVRLFAAFLVPGSGVTVEEARSLVLDALAGVPDLEHDQALHELVSLVEATTRSNWALGR